METNVKIVKHLTIQSFAATARTEGLSTPFRFPQLHNISKTINIF